MAKEETNTRKGLDPRLAGAIASAMHRSERGRLKTLLEDQDPRFLAGQTDEIRRAVDNVFYGSFDHGSLRTPDKARACVADLVAFDPAVAFPLSTSGNGFIRQAAIEAITEISGAICLGLVVQRLNDWVPDVRRAAMATLESLAERVPPEAVVEAAEVLWVFERVGRAEEEARAQVSSLLARNDVIAGLKKRILRGKDNKSYRLLKLALRSPGFDEILPGLLRDHRHQAARALAARALFEGRHVWQDGARQKSRAVACTCDREALAQELLAEMGVRVKVHALSYLAYHMENEAALTAILLRFVAHPRLTLARLAQWRLGKLGFDWLSWLRDTFDRKHPDPNIARVLGYAGTAEDGDLLDAVAKGRAPREALPFLAASAQLKNQDALRRLQDLALKGSEEVIAQRAARALIEADEPIPFTALKDLADAGHEFLSRGLQPHLRRCDVLGQLNLLCRLESSDAYVADTEDFRRLRRRLNRGRFQPRADDEQALAAILGRCPVVAARMRNQLMITLEDRADKSKGEDWSG